MGIDEIREGRVAPASSPYAGGGPERRQLSVMFCDLVGSTLLAQRIDPEDLREVMSDYRRVCTPIIERYSGYVSRYMGDGILALFGFPLAYEDSAGHAVRAGLDILAGFVELHDKWGEMGVEPQQVRIGVATGVVIAGDRIGEGPSQEEAVVGETPNLAARLQDIAEPGAMVIADFTHTLVRGRFECRDLGDQDLKGFATPQRVWQVVGERRQGEVREGTFTPLVNREAELGLLLAGWQRARDGEGRIVLLNGEGGIGKSRLARELEARVADEPHRRLRYQCSPYYATTPLFPFVDQLSRAAGIDAADSAEGRLRKLEEVLGLGHDDPATVLPFVAALLSVPMPAPDPLAGMPAPRVREHTIRALVTYLLGLSAREPVLVVFEDLHWIDPTSLQLIALLVDELRHASIMAVMTMRPGFAPAWAGEAHVTLMGLTRLGRADGDEIVRHVAGTRSLPPDVVSRIVERTDGVPLYLEELTRTVLESGLQLSADDGPPGRTSRASPTIPASLKDSLMARLDQYAEVRGIAQVAATIGRRFSHGLLEAVARRDSGLTRRLLNDALKRLVDADLIVQRGSPPDALYTFRHALVRDAAYDSLLRRRREALHRHIVEALEGDFPGVAETAPELLAYHCTEAARPDAAIGYWLRAARRSAERSANQESVNQIRAGLALLPAIPEPEQRKRRELELRVALGTPLISSQGPGSPEVAEGYNRALELCREVPESEEHFKAHWGWWRVSMNHSIGRSRADAVLALASRLDEPGLMLQAHHCQWATRFHLGDHVGCCEHVAAGLALYDGESHGRQAAEYGGHDARVCAHGERALSSWLRGDEAGARADLTSAIDWADALGHVGSVAHARDYALLLSVYRDDPERVAQLAGELHVFAKEQNLPDYLARARLVLGWAQARLGQDQEGLDEMEQAMAQLKSNGTKEDFPMFLDLMAQVNLRLGDPEAGLSRISAAFTESEQAGLRFWLAELFRRKAELLRARAGPDQNEAEILLRRGLETARAQGAVVFRARAAVDLAGLLADSGRHEAARDVARSMDSWFTAGTEPSAVSAARELLAELR